MGKAINEVHYKGVYWKDIEWSKKIHLMERCDCCGSDGAEGHQNSCYYLWDMMESPRGRSFLKHTIKQALKREQEHEKSKKK